ALTGTARTYAADLSDPKIADGVLTRAIQENGPVDILINNAGVQHIDHFTKITNETAQQLLNLNYSTPAQLMRQVLPSMVERDTGIVINTASLGAITPTPYMAEYCASKAALAALATALSGEYKDSKIHFITVYPGRLKRPWRIMPMSVMKKARWITSPLAQRKGWLKKFAMRLKKRNTKLCIQHFTKAQNL
ncbi:MAG TPA: SDR family oxidoreductase, partial [Turneriella sp.]|nr:SDR family oxidoreductase [Turneriella sp.]